MKVQLAQEIINLKIGKIFQTPSIYSLHTTLVSNRRKSKHAWQFPNYIGTYISEGKTIVKITKILFAIKNYLAFMVSDVQFGNSLLKKPAIDNA
jgi:hypothetical protein